MNETLKSTAAVGKRLVELCKEQKFRQAVKELYGPNIVSTEAIANPSFPQRIEGLAAVLEKTEWWEKNNEVHGCEVSGPFPHGDRFIVIFKMDVTAHAGPMAGKRMQMEEAGLYAVKDGKVVKEEFFYGGCDQ